MGRACQLGSPRGGDPWEAKEGPHKTQSLQNEKQQLRDEQPQPDGDERRVTRLRGSPLREERADKKRGLKGRTVNILLLFLGNPSRQQHHLFVQESVFYLPVSVADLFTICCKFLQSCYKQPKKKKCVRVFVFWLLC